jgi:hypothetical protein
MKLHFMSDLHLEFEDMKLPGGDAIVVAGDLLVSHILMWTPQPYENPSTVKRYTEYADRFTRFVKEELSKYEKRYVLAGNHEYYHGIMNFVNEDLFEFYRKNNVTFLNPGMVEVSDKVFLIGTTLWTDMYKEDPMAMGHARRSLNDFCGMIEVADGQGLAFNKRLFTPQDSVDLHKQSLVAINTAYKNAVDLGAKKVIVATHHAPTGQSVDDRYAGSIINACYHSELGDFILDRPLIQNWIHGHMHNTNDYMVGQCRVQSNPRGYHGDNHRFDPLAHIEV